MVSNPPTPCTALAAGDGLNLATNQTTLLAGSVPFAPTNAAIPIVQAGIGSALMTSLNKVVVNLNYDAVLTGSSSTDCNALFAIYPSATPTTAKSSPSPILDCSMAEGDKRAVTLTLINNTIFTPGKLSGVVLRFLLPVPFLAICVSLSTCQYGCTPQRCVHLG